MFDFLFFRGSVLLLGLHDLGIVSLEDVVREWDQSYLVLNLFNLYTHSFDGHSFGQDVDKVVEEGVHHLAHIPVELGDSLVWLEESLELDEVVLA